MVFGQRQIFKNAGSPSRCREQKKDQQKNLRHDERREGREIDVPSRNLGSNFDSSISNARAESCRKTCTSHRVDDPACGRVADGGTGLLIPFIIKLLVLAHDTNVQRLALGTMGVRTVSLRDVESAPGDVEDVAVEDRILADEFRSECGGDPEFAVLDIGILVCVGGHCEFAITAARLSVNQTRKGSEETHPKPLMSTSRKNLPLSPNKPSELSKFSSITGQSLLAGRRGTLFQPI